eukprot:3924315-Rhodomonas_salina.1
MEEGRPRMHGILVQVKYTITNGTKQRATDRRPKMVRSVDRKWYPSWSTRSCTAGQSFVAPRVAHREFIWGG